MTFPRAMPLSAAALWAVAGLAPGAQAAPIDVTFAPPEIEARAVCAPRPPGHVLTERWADWQGQGFDGRPVALVRRDLRLLRQRDAEGWFETISAAQDLLRAEVESYGPTDQMLDRLDLLMAADRMEAAREEGLFEALLEAAETGPIKAKIMAAELLLAGEGLEADRPRAIALFREAAYGGHPTALLQMARLASEGAEIGDWNIDPEVAVTMAFGARIGEVDALVCDRINQIAGEYRDGEVVTRNPALAEEWYRLSASIGGANAAWDVAQYHLDAQEIDKDNAVLLDHLEQASDFGLTFAMAEYAQILNRGALTDRDSARARDIYERAAGYGDRTALTRLAGMARAENDGSEADLTRVITRLTALTELTDPPAWAFVQRGDAYLARDGRWGGAEAALADFRRAAEIDGSDHAAELRLARLNLRAIEDRQDFLDVTSALRNVVRANGRTGPMEDLQTAHMCRGPAAPQPQEAAYWAGMEQFSGDETVELSAEALARVDRETAPLVYAKLQSQALNARARSLAHFDAVTQEDRGLAPLRGLARAQGAQVHVARAQVAETRGEMQAAREHLRAAIAAGEGGARMRLIEHLRDADPSEETRARMLELARALAAEGQGQAIEILIAEDPALDAAGAWAKYREAIARNGDFAGLIFALPYLAEEGAPLGPQLGRIRSLADCSAEGALRFAEALQALDETERAQHWLEIARSQAQGSGWRLVSLADAILEEGFYETPMPRAEELYRAAIELGYPQGMRRLLSLRQEGRIEMPAPEATDLWVDFLRDAPIDEVASGLNLLDYSDAEVARAVRDRVDTRALYETAAEKGNPLAQLELARILRDEARGPEEMARYGSLLRAAAGQGNAEAMFLLSQAYAYGIGVDRSQSRSDDWLFRAAEAGHAPAQSTARMIDNARTEPQ
ncbi:hypothetical protein LR948_16465 [Roseivivax sp. GX 12232]|uniref:tetratricopeptide repeat protein n=1 Tax=Roseivivax sp. GX 12232 TaxID=2900547 RepID=UPI001E5A5DCA|nr:hypothetical protein [Roseivivax sp. GX 12232]MCE0506965.1 hypothetical protein [Roseivivax sp. GX 12232]